MNEKTKQALDMIDKALSTVVGTRQDHINLQVALNVIKQELTKEEKEKEE